MHVSVERLHASISPEGRKITGKLLVQKGQLDRKIVVLLCLCFQIFKHEKLNLKVVCQSNKKNSHILITQIYPLLMILMLFLSLICVCIQVSTYVSVYYRPTYLPSTYLYKSRRRAWSVYFAVQKESETNKQQRNQVQRTQKLDWEGSHLPMDKIKL